MQAELHVIRIPRSLIERPEFVAACTARDMGKVFAMVGKYGHSKMALSRATGVSPDRIRNLIAGTRVIEGIEVFERISDGLGIPGVMLGLATRPWERVDQEVPAPGVMARPSDLTEDDEATVERRRFLLGSAGTAAALIASEPRDMKKLFSVGKQQSSRIEYFENAAENFGTEVIRVASPNLLEASLIAFRDARMLALECTREADRNRVIRTNAKLANVIGLILFDTNRFDAAHEWYLTARGAAVEVGDEYLADIGLAGQAYVPTYSNDPEGVLSLLLPRLESRTTSTPATAWLWAFCGKAYAALGNRDQAERAFECSERALNESAAEAIRVGIYSFLPEKLDMYRAHGYVSLQLPDKAIAAAQKALLTYDPKETTEPSLARFELASALLQAGETEEACKVATQAVAGPNVFMNISIRQRAERFKAEIPNPRNPAAREWNDVLWSVSA